MSHGILGVGLCHCGTAVAGYGEPYTGEEPQGSDLQDQVNGNPQDARFIDPYTRDYIIDQQGQFKGQSSISQQVYLSLITTFGTSVNPTLGSQFSNIKTFSKNNIIPQMKSEVNKALSTLIKNNSIQLLNVEVSLNPNNVATNITVYWRDNINNQDQQTSI